MHDGSLPSDSLRARAYAAARASAFALGCCVAGACRAPTQIHLSLHTDAPCGRVRGVTISAGPRALFEDAAPAVVAYSCATSGLLGDVFLTPDSSDVGSVAVKAVLGLDNPAEACTRSTRYQGCIVARRILPYLPHETMRVRIELQKACGGMACSSDTTCARGECIAALQDPTACVDSECTLEGSSRPSSENRGDDATH